MIYIGPHRFLAVLIHVSFQECMYRMVVHHSLLSLIFVRRIIDGPLDVHPSQPAIVVHYEVEATVISEYGEPMVADRKQARKMYVNKIIMSKK